MKEQKLKENKLFQSSNDYGNVVLNFRRQAEDEFDVYARSFHRAGQLLANEMLSSARYSDLDACPIIFSYRHSLELYLKAIARIGKTIVELTEEEIKDIEKHLEKHKLSSFLPILKKVFDQVGWDWDFNIEGLRTFEELELLLKEFDDFDKGSFTFRYPIDNKERPSLPHHFMVNIPNFCVQMNELLNLLDGASMGLREITLR